MKKDNQGGYTLCKKDLERIGIVALMVHNGEKLETIEQELGLKSKEKFDEFFEFTCQLMVENGESLANIHKKYYAENGNHLA